MQAKSDMRGIFTISLMCKRPHKALAAYNSSYQRLFVTNCAPVNPKRQSSSAWLPPLIEDINTYIQKGYSVLIEDITGSLVVNGATPFSFEEIYEDRPMLFHALDYNFSMQSLQQIEAEAAVESFLIKANAEGSKIDTIQDDKGRTAYRVDWSNFDGGHKAVLMCICAAMLPPVTENYLEEMYSHMIEAENEEKPLSSWEAVIRGRILNDYTKMKEW